jgi:hypothetical protein
VKAKKLSTVMGIYHVSFWLNTGHTNVWASPECWQLLTNQHGIIAHENGIFVTTALRTLDHTNEMTLIYNTETI